MPLPPPRPPSWLSMDQLGRPRGLTATWPPPARAAGGGGATARSAAAASERSEGASCAAGLQNFGPCGKREEARLLY
jgi:hypothetical protein